MRKRRLTLDERRAMGSATCPSCEIRHDLDEGVFPRHSEVVSSDDGSISLKLCPGSGQAPPQVKSGPRANMEEVL